MKVSNNLHAAELYQRAGVSSAGGARQVEKPPVEEKKPQAAAKPGSDAASAQFSGAGVTLARQALEAQQAQAPQASQAVADAGSSEKVQALKKAVESGDYMKNQFSATTTAKRILYG